MRIRSVRGSHHNRSPDRQPTEIQTSGQFRLALEWRDCWRQEKLKSQNVTVDPVWKDRDKEKRKRFAEGIARAEFGRAYWDGRLQGGGVQLRTARKEKSKARQRANEP